MGPLRSRTHTGRRDVCQFYPETSVRSPGVENPTVSTAWCLEPMDGGKKQWPSECLRKHVFARPFDFEGRSQLSTGCSRIRQLKHNQIRKLGHSRILSVWAQFVFFLDIMGVKPLYALTRGGGIF